MSNISTRGGNDPTQRIVTNQQQQQAPLSSNNIEEPISSYGKSTSSRYSSSVSGSSTQSPTSAAIHFIGHKTSMKSQSSSSSSSMTVTKWFIVLFSVMLIFSISFVYIHTTSLDTPQGIPILDSPMIFTASNLNNNNNNNNNNNPQQQRLLNDPSLANNPLLAEELKLQQERDRFLQELLKKQQQVQQQIQQLQQQQATTTSSTTITTTTVNSDVPTNSGTTSNSIPNSLKTIDDYRANIDNDADPINRQRRLSVIEAMKHAYHNYERYAMGHDELKPVSRSYKDWVSGGMAMTMVDSLDTLYIMGLKDEFNRAISYTKNKMPSFSSIRSTVSVFETVIRMVGGFLSAYDLSGERIFLDKAREMGDIMGKAFDPSTNMFAKSVNLHTGNADRSGSVVLAEVGTLQLEFRRLSQLTGDPKYDDMVTRVMNELRSHGPSDGLYPVSYSPQGRRFYGMVTMGGLGDSFFEYLLKQWLMTGKTEQVYLDMYQKSLHGIMTKMVDNFDNRNPPVSFIADYNGHKIRNVQHLACFTSGMLALGEANKASQSAPPELQVDSKEVMKVAEQFAQACVESYRMTKTGIGPEGFQYTPDGAIHGSGYYILRPETVESLFVLYRVTGDKKYQEMAWELFSNLEKSCKVANGYSGLHNVNQPGSYNDVQESFFLAETLKYLYLIFSPNEVIPLDEWVFNTEAHPLKITHKK